MAPKHRPGHGLGQHARARRGDAVWQYWRATGDDDFFLSAGAEILLDTARFWALRAVAEADSRRHIRHVIGPDELPRGRADEGHENTMGRIVPEIRGERKFSILCG
jgi:trehalose/maltose hydrolase-like predicted phosphorylase